MALRKRPRGETAGYMARSEECFVFVCPPFFTFALSLSLGEMGVLRTLSESGGRACVQSALFLFDENCPSEMSTFGQQSLPTVAQ
jgi:hypothetical protein